MKKLCFALVLALPLLSACSNPQKKGQEMPQTNENSPDTIEADHTHVEPDSAKAAPVITPDQGK